MQQEFRPEVRAYERVGPSGMLHNILSGVQMPDSQGKLARQSLKPEDRFYMAIDAISRKWSSAGILPLQETDINNILDKAKDISNIKYMNPVAFILGYWATQGGKNYDQVNTIIKDTLPLIKNEGSVYPEDVIRYARYWKTFL